MKNSRPEDVGMDSSRLRHLGEVIKHDVDRELYDGAAIARHGSIAMHEAFGFSDRAKRRPARIDNVFLYFSITRAATAVTVLSRVERGDLALTTRIADVIPEFGALGKQRITIANLLSHTGGMMGGIPPVPIGNLQAVIEFTCKIPPEAVPGEAVSYSSTVAYSVLAEVVRRVDGNRRSAREILTQEVLEPLGMRDTWLGARKDLVERRVPVGVRDRRASFLPADKQHRRRSPGIRGRQTLHLPG